MWHDVTWHDMTWHADVTWHDMLMWHDMTALICEEILFTNLLTNFILKNCRQSVNKLKTTWRNRVPWALLVLCSSSSLFSPTHKIWLKTYQRKLLTCPKTYLGRFWRSRRAESRPTGEGGAQGDGARAGVQQAVADGTGTTEERRKIELTGGSGESC